ncbi:MAG: sodium/solute symporter [Saprospiraceae bacterium]|nr:sodium/solute symporter [Saprospiraceae bacterium]
MIWIDGLIVLIYFFIILMVALSGRAHMAMSSEAYFLSNRNLTWPSIALSTIATNIQGYQFLGMMGSAYLFGLAQANLEVNAITGLWMAAFIFVPLYLKDKIITITQFIAKRLGERVALFYSVANLLIFSTIGLGAALFWGAYAAELVFSDYLLWLSPNRLNRVMIVLVSLGIFSAIYTWYGGLSAVVRTDVIQFSLLFLGGIVVLFVSIHQLGGWSELYRKTPELMHLHLPVDHPTLPWPMVFGLFLLNINYWCANQSVMQRSLAARSLKHAQAGLLVGGLMKVFMAVIIIVPGIALAGILADQPLAEPDQSFPYLVSNYLPVGIRGLILCALFASLMSTVDSTFNSLATLWSIDIYQKYINPNASDRQLVQAGRRTIGVTLLTGITMGGVLLYVKFNNPEDAFTHTLNELRYYVNCGIVVIICTAAFLVKPKHRLTLAAFLATVPLQLLFKAQFPEMNYFVRAMWVILLGGSIVWIPAIVNRGWRKWSDLFVPANTKTQQYGYCLLALMVIIHIIFS